MVGKLASNGVSDIRQAAGGSTGRGFGGGYLEVGWCSTWGCYGELQGSRGWQAAVGSSSHADRSHADPSVADPPGSTIRSQHLSGRYQKHRRRSVPKGLGLQADRLPPGEAAGRPVTRRPSPSSPRRPAATRTAAAAASRHPSRRRAPTRPDAHRSSEPAAKNPSRDRGRPRSESHFDAECTKTAVTQLSPIPAPWRASPPSFPRERIWCLADSGRPSHHRRIPCEAPLTLLEFLVPHARFEPRKHAYPRSMGKPANVHL